MHAEKKPLASGLCLEDLGVNPAGYRQALVLWRGEHFRLSVRREEALATGPKTAPRARPLSIVVARCDEGGELLEDGAEVRDEELHELQEQARIFAAWGGGLAGE